MARVGCDILPTDLFSLARLSRLLVLECNAVEEIWRAAKSLWEKLALVCSEPLDFVHVS